MRNEITEDELIAAVEKLPTWGNPRTDEEKWRQRYGEVYLARDTDVLMRRTIKDSKGWDWPSRVSLIGEHRISYKDAQNFRIHPDHQQWWRNNPGEYLLAQDSRENGGDSEFGASFENINFRGSAAGSSERLANCLLWRSDDRAWLEKCAFLDFYDVGIWAMNCRRAVIRDCLVLGQMKSVQQSKLPTSTGIAIQRGNLHLDSVFLHRLKDGVTLDGVEQYTDANCHFEEVRTPYRVSGAKGFQNIGINTIRTANKVLLQADANAFRCQRIAMNVQNIYDDSSGKREPSEDAGALVHGDYHKLVTEGAHETHEHKLATWPKSQAQEEVAYLRERIHNLEADLATLENAHRLHTHDSPGRTTSPPTEGRI